MRSLLLGMLMLVCINSQAQDYYQANLTEVYVVSKSEGELVKTASVWESTLIEVDREYLLFKKDDGTIVKEWWAFFKNDGALGECYITEKDCKVCISTKYNTIFLYYNYNEEDDEFKNVATLSHIIKSKPFEY